MFGMGRDRRDHHFKTAASVVTYSRFLRVMGTWKVKECQGILKKVVGKVKEMGLASGK